jgi:CRISPR-associated protein Cas1
MRSLLFLPDPGTALQHRRGQLCIRGKDGTETLYPPRTHKLKTIILAGPGASVTAEAIRWAARENVSLFLMALSGECHAVFAEAVKGTLSRRGISARQAQWKAFLDPHKRLEIARRIVRAKLHTLGLHPTDARGFREELAEAQRLEDILTAEARAGAAYWLRWKGFPIEFRDEVPATWCTFTARAGTLLRGHGGTSKVRYAATPIGAMHNYALAVALGQVTRTVVGAGFDPYIGFLHSLKPGRLSFSYDVLELIRAELAEAVFGFATKRTFRRTDFEIDPRGIVRLGSTVAWEIAAVALRVCPMAEYVKTVRRVAAWFQPVKRCG